MHPILITAARAAAPVAASYGRQVVTAAGHGILAGSAAAALIGGMAIGARVTVSVGGALVDGTSAALRSTKNLFGKIRRTKTADTPATPVAAAPENTPLIEDKSDKAPEATDTTPAKKARAKKS